MDDRLERPHDADCARDRIEAAVRQIQIISDEFGFDPCEWLNDETAQGDRPAFYHCRICGGTVNFPEGAEPSMKIGAGQPLKRRETPAMKLLGVDIAPPCSCAEGIADPCCWHHGINADSADAGTK